MYLRLLQIRDIDDVNRYIALLGSVERVLGRWEALQTDPAFSSLSAHSTVAPATAASMRLSGWEANTADIEALLENRPAELRPGFEAAALGYADTIRLVMDHFDEVPFAESQIKYFQSLLLRYDLEGAEHRRVYRRSGTGLDNGMGTGLRTGTGTGPRTDERPGVEPELSWGLPALPPAERVADEMPRLVAWTRGALDAGEIHPLLAIGVFLHRLLVLRPFGRANGRLARVLATYFLARYGYSHVRCTAIEEVVEARRNECVLALERVAASAAEDREDVGPWIEFFAGVVTASIEQAIERAIEQIGSAAGEAVLPPRQTEILSAFGDRGSAKIGDLLPDVGCSRATLKRDLKELVDTGRLTVTGVGKGTVYHLVRSRPSLIKRVP